MSYQLVIAEKPSVARSIAAVIGATDRQDGYLQGNGYLVSWCIGHLVSFADAALYDERFKKWRYEDLPIIPESWRLTVPPNKRERFDTLRTLLRSEEVSEVVNACDAGREGELIFRTVYHLAGCTKPMKRLWISSMEDSAIREGFANLKPGRDYDPLHQSALCRAKADWLIGINATRLFSVLYHKTLTVGRVQTPTLNAPTANPYKWEKGTISRILERVDYLGHTVNFKTSKPSFKSKKKVWNNPSEWVIFENTQEPIIEESVFLIVQNIRQGRRRPTKMGDMGMFSGLVYCADCGGKMYLCRANHFKPEQEYYICSTYRKDRTLCKTHSIRRVVLEEIVLRNLREAISYVTQYEDDFIQRAAERSLRERDKALAQKKAVLAQSEKRIAELDVIFKRIYEDNISGKLSDDRFIKLSRDYEQEQEQLKAIVETLGREVKQQEQKKTNVRKFISVVKKYTDMTQLDATILREFVEQIRVSDTYTTDEQQKRVKIREIEIVYNFIGAFDFEEAREQSQTAQDKNNAKVGAA